MEQIERFINDPLVAPIYALLVITVIDFLLAVYRNIQQHVFDWNKLPEVLDSTVLKVVIPLAAIGVASFFVSESVAQTGLQAAYVAGAATALAGAVSSLLGKVTNDYVGTTKAMDQGLVVGPATPQGGPGS